MKHTKGPWKAKRWDSINVAIYPPKPKNGMIVALAQIPGVGGPVTQIERACNIRLIEEAPRMFDVLCRARDLCLEDRHDEALELMRDAIAGVEQERIPENY
jgi:hypothetical protein